METPWPVDRLPSIQSQPMVLGGDTVSTCSEHPIFQEAGNSDFHIKFLKFEYYSNTFKH